MIQYFAEKMLMNDSRNDMYAHECDENPATTSVVHVMTCVYSVLYNVQYTCIHVHCMDSSAIHELFMNMFMSIMYTNTST